MAFSNVGAPLSHASCSFLQETVQLVQINAEINLFSIYPVVLEHNLRIVFEIVIKSNLYILTSRYESKI